MKKALLLVIFLLLLASKAEAAVVFLNGNSDSLIYLDTVSGFVGFASSTPGSLLSLNNIVNFTTATSTFYGNGINLTSGCFAIAGTCIGAGSSGTVTNIATTYPITGGAITTTGTLALAFGTTTANTWASVQTFGAASTTDISASHSVFGSFASAVWLADANKLATAATVQTCTNQFFRSLSAAYVVTCASVANTDLTNSTINFTYQGEITGGASVALGSTLTVNASTSPGVGFINATSTTLSSTFAYRLGVASTTPWGSLSVQGASAQVNPVFMVASSSGASLFQISPNGLVSQSGYKPTVATNTGAGSGNVPVTVLGSPNFFTLIFTSGTAPTANFTIATATLPSSCPSALVPVMTPGNAAAATLWGATTTVASSTASNTFTITSGAVALQASKTYIFNIQIGCY